MHMFVDESERNGYRLVGTLLEPFALHSTRTLMRGLLLPGERRVHFKSEKDSRRKVVVSQLVRAGFRVRLYTRPGRGEAVRAEVLEHLVTDAIALGVTRLVLDSRDVASNKRDRVAIANRTKAREAGLVYEHIQASAEPALWISDAVAWCHGAGSDWRRRVNPLIAEVVEVG
ncbi:hypothetical protein JOF41_000425 [Saccharothrix coeruleofusca]|nr:hypothetical protein [Saccharothrix coeruleofusca]